MKSKSKIQNEIEKFDKNVNDEKIIDVFENNTIFNISNDTNIDVKNINFHLIKNFVWSHKRFNIHRSQFVDILHQLFKKFVIYVLIWCIDVTMKITFDIRCQTTIATLKIDVHKRKRIIVKKNWKIQVNERFQSISSFFELKCFIRFNIITQ